MSSENVSVAQLERPPAAPESEKASIEAEYGQDPYGLLEKMVKTYGPVCHLPIGPEGMVVVADAEIAEKVLRLDFHNFVRSTEQEDQLSPLLGQSFVVISDRERWQKIHDVILPNFTPKMLLRYYEKTLEIVRHEVEELAELAESGKQFSFYEFARRGVLGALTNTLFIRGIQESDVDMLLEADKKTYPYIAKLFLFGEEVTSQFDDPEIIEGRESLEKINSYIANMVQMRRQDLRDEPEDMLDVMIAATMSDGSKMSDKQLQDDIAALFWGGQDTTPATVSWAFNYLSNNPDKRQLMLEEIDQVLEGRVPTFQELERLEYTKGVFDEALRLRTNGVTLSREAVKDTELGGYLVSKGERIGIVPYVIHRDPRDWPDPETFDPAHHTKERRAQRNKCAFLAFGYGERRCIGERVGRMEAMLMLTLISQRFLLDRVGGGMSPKAVSMAVKPTDGLPMQVSSRR